MIVFKRLLPIPSFVALLIFTILTIEMSAQVKEILIIDSLTQKPSDELGKRIKKSTPKEAKIYEIALSNLKDQDSAKTNEFYYIALYFNTLENYERSAYYFGHAAMAAKQAKYDQFLCSIYLKQANAYLKDWKNEEALDVYDKVLEIVQQKGSIRHQILANSGITIIRRRMKQLDKALEICKQNLKLVQSSSFNNGKNHVNLYTIISEIYLDQKQYDSAIVYVDKGIAISSSINYPIGDIDLYTKKGAISYYRNNITEAFEYLEHAQDILQKNSIKEKKSIINLNYFLSNCYFKQKEYSKAIVLLEENILKLDKNDSRNVKTLETYRLLADCYKANGNEEKYVYWIDKHTRLRDKFLDDKDKTVNEIYKKDTQKLDAEIETLKVARKQEQQSRNYMVSLFIAVFVLLLFIVGYYYKKYTKNKTLFTDLIEKMQALESKEFIQTKKTKEVIIDDTKINAVLKGLDKLEQKEYFLNTDCSLRSIAQKIKINTTYLSKIINTHKEKSFNDYINDLRIEYALKRLKNDKKFRSFSITSIASEIGYKSDNSFTKHFKAKTGLNPSYYIKKIEKLEKTT